jgi:uncharacterized RDD family membrane protein YckC
MRFDEMELQPAALDLDVPVVAEAPAEPVVVAANTPAPRFRRLLALLTDLSLFAALALALSPLLPASQSPLSVGALAGFVIVVSYYYYAGTWLLWGKTIGGAIFDVRVVPAGAPAMALGNASKRWIALLLSLATGGIGLMFAALPSRLSVPDRVSGTRCVTG